MKKNKGFTLIELLVVIAIIAIIGILSSVVLASLNNARCKSKEKQGISCEKDSKQTVNTSY